MTETGLPQDATKTNSALQRLLVAILLLTPIAQGNEAETKSALNSAEPGIGKIALLTAKERSPILFAVVSRDCWFLTGIHS
jgi:hypothetical protein